MLSAPNPTIPAVTPRLNLMLVPEVPNLWHSWGPRYQRNLKTTSSHPIRVSLALIFPKLFNNGFLSSPESHEAQGCGLHPTLRFRLPIRTDKHNSFIPQRPEKYSPLRLDGRPTAATSPLHVQIPDSLSLLPHNRHPVCPPRLLCQILQEASF